MLGICVAVNCKGLACLTPPLLPSLILTIASSPESFLPSAGQTKEVLSSSSVDSCDRSVLAAVEMLVEWVRDAAADGDGVMFTGLLGTVRHVLLSVLRCEVCTNLIRMLINLSIQYVLYV